MNKFKLAKNTDNIKEIHKYAKSNNNDVKVGVVNNANTSAETLKKL